MRIKTKRISKLKREYGPIAKKSKLRLSEQRIRKLERERIKSGKSFKKVFQDYKKQRILDSVRRIAKKQGVDRKQAREIRKIGVKKGVSYIEAANILVQIQLELERVAGPVEDVVEDLAGPVEEVLRFVFEGPPITFLNFYDKILDLKSKVKEGEEGPLAVVNFGAYTYEGPLMGIDLGLLKSMGDDLENGIYNSLLQTGEMISEEEEMEEEEEEEREEPRPKRKSPPWIMKEGVVQVIEQYSDESFNNLINLTANIDISMVK